MSIVAFARVNVTPFVAKEPAALWRRGSGDWSDRTQRCAASGGFRAAW
jgi:hypothetical protein